MGNSSSKSKKNGNGPGLQSYPSFSRTDTQNSTRSQRSIRSRMSVLSEGSFKSAMESPPKGSETGLGGSGTPRGEGIAVPGISANSGADGYFAGVNNSDLPRSMQHHEPKEPILMRRDKDGQIQSPYPPATPSSEDPPPLGLGQDGATDSMSGSNNGPGSSPGGPASPGAATGAGAGAGQGQGIPGAGSQTNSPNQMATSVGGGSGHRLSMPTTPVGVPMRGGTPTVVGGMNIDEIIQRLLDAGYSGKTTKSLCLKNNEVVAILTTAREIFMSQPALLELSPPVKIVGDVHGQYGDLIRLFDMCGFPPAANYLFLGDYVDRGKQSLETILLLLCYKIKYPENFFLLRGNHECASVTRVYGFFDECKRRSSVKTWKVFMDTFNCLPIAAVVAQKIFCVHGGLSPSLNNLNEIREIERPTDIPDYGLLNDLVWSDPADTVNEWEDNERGVSYCFNKVAINKFLTKFGFDLVCRAHMVVEDGYEFFNDKSLVTVFSAPNYCGEFDNWGAVMSVSEELLCSFELLKPLDSVQLKHEMRKGKHERRNGLANLGTSPYSGPQSY